MSFLRNWWLLIAVAAIGAGVFAFVWLRAGVVDDGPVMALPSAYATGIAAAERGEWSAASQAFDEALKADPNAPPLLFALGTAHIEAGRPLTGAVYLSAYLEALPNAANASRAKARLQAILAIYRDAAKDMAAEAVAQLDGIVNDEARAVRARAMAAQLLDLSPAVFGTYGDFAAKHPSRITEATVDYVIARGTGLSAPAVAQGWLVAAIEAEAGAASEDVWRAGCFPIDLFPAPAYVPCESLIAQGTDRVQACLNQQAGVGASNRVVQRGDRDLFASHLYFYAAARLWASGAGSQAIVGPLGDSYKARNVRGRQQGATGRALSRNCGTWPGNLHGLQIIYLADGSGMDAWLPPPPPGEPLSSSRVDFSKPAPVAASVPAVPPWRTWREVVTQKTIDVGPERVALPFDDPVFGDLSDAVRVIGRETAETRPERLGTLAWRLGLLVQRLDPL